MEKTVFEMTQQELIDLNTQYLKRIQELEEEVQRLKSMYETKVCSQYIPNNQTNMNCVTCGEPKFLH